jgi:hypothetical protein
MRWRSCPCDACHARPRAASPSRLLGPRRTRHTHRNPNARPLPPAPQALWVGGIALDLPAWRRPGVIAGFLRLLGVTVEWRGEANLPAGRHVLVSNHVSNGDLLMLFGRPRRYLHLITPLLPKPVFKTRNLPAMLAPANKETFEALGEVAAAGGSGEASSSGHGGNGHGGHAAVAHAAAAHATAGHAVAGHDAAAAASERRASGGGAGTSGGGAPRRRRLPREAEAAPVHLFPEGGMTNGRGMMAFSRGFTRFAPGGVVVPVALRLRAPFPQVWPDPCCRRPLALPAPATPPPPPAGTRAFPSCKSPPAADASPA